MSTLNDFYVVLEVVRTASEDDIKRAFRRLARRYHPDINPGDTVAEEHFKRISEAYEILSDPSKREFYDRNGFYAEGMLEQHETHGTWGFTFKNFDMSGVYSRSDTFSRSYSRRILRREPERGQDLEYQMAIAFEESISGLKAQISVQRRHRCPACNGNGRAAVHGRVTCPSCGGSGKQTRARGRLKFLSPCEECSGTGYTLAECPDCGGEGRIPRTDVVEMDIPAGVSAGSRIRFEGKGDAGKYGGPSGDLYVITNVTPHPFFKRVGDNFQCVLPVTFVEAALGAKVEMPTVDGKTVVRILPGTQNGDVLRLRGKGAPSLRQPGVRGDQFVEIRVSVPHIADERSKEILKEFAQLNPENVRETIGSA